MRQSGGPQGVREPLAPGVAMNMCVAELRGRRVCWTEEAKELRGLNVDLTIVWRLMFLRTTGGLREREKTRNEAILMLMNE